MRFGSLFAGVGGFDLGLERAGMECAWQVEIDPYCQKVLAKHWPKVKRFSDVRECGKHNLPSVDLVCGGFPCQPFSVAGKQRGANDDRNLWPEMLRIVEECRPRWVVCENTPGIFGLYLDTVLANLESAGYEAWTVDIPAAGVGAHHRRNRIWIIAHSEHNAIPHDEFNKACNANTDRSCSHVEDTNCGGLLESGVCSEQPRRAEVVRTGEDVPNAASQRRLEMVEPNTRGAGSERRIGEVMSSTRDWWATEPELGRVAHGVPHRVDRLRALGNAVVPQVVELIGRAILAAEVT